MISFLIAGAVGLTALQAGIDAPRKAFVACLKEASGVAESQKIAAGDFGSFLVKQCDTQANSLKAGLIGFDVKNGIKRAQASADAQAQVDDYVAISAENYESRLTFNKPRAAPAPAATAVTPPVVAASAPKN